VRVAVDGRFFRHPSRGGFKIYLESLVPEYVANDGGHTFTIYTDRSAEGSTQLSERVALRDLGITSRPGYDQIALTRALRAAPPDVAFFPTNTMPMRYAGPAVVTLHDTIPIFDSKLMPQITGRRMKHRLITLYDAMLMRFAARRANHIITVSEFARRDIIERLGVDPARISVVYPGKNIIFRRLDDRRAVEETLKRRWNLPLGYILCLGSPDLRKNIPRVMEAYARLIQSARDIPPLVLVVTAAHMKDRYLRLAAALGIGDRVVYLSGLTHEELVFVYNGACLLAFPSLYETFGNPCIEAMACGTPVLTSNASAIPEVVGDAAEQVTPTDVSSMAERMRALITDTALRDRRIGEGLRRAARYSWSEHARQTIAIFERVAGVAR